MQSTQGSSVSREDVTLLVDMGYTEEDAIHALQETQVCVYVCMYVCVCMYV